MEPTRSSPVGRWTAGLLLSLALVASACSDGGDDPLSASGTSGTDGSGTTAFAQETTDSSAGQEADSGTTAPGLPQPAEDGSTGDGSSSATEDGDETETAVPAIPWDQTQLVLQPVAAFEQPIGLTSRPGSDDLWVVERPGRVRRIDRVVDEAADTEQLVQTTTIVLDITDRVDTTGEGGLLGLAFSADGNKLYAHYTDNNGFNTVISEFEMGADTADPASERILIRFPQPFTNHNGGDLHFGADGMLYASLGDGGSADDPLGSGQDTTTLLGAILRIDPRPSAGAPYTIPSDNPFVGGGGAAEIWAYGLRNPFRFSFDPATGDMWIGDVGQGRIEEIDFAVNPGNGAPGRGANFGWKLMEGNEQFSGSAPPQGHVGPLYSYDHSEERCSVTGGFVSRGGLTPALDGVYIFADYCQSVLTGVQRHADGSTTAAALLIDRTPENVISFGQGPDGNVYVMEQGGRLSRIQGADVTLETTLSSR